MKEKKVLKAFDGKVLVTELETGEKVLKSGIIIPSDDGKSTGIHSRWAKVYAIGSDIKDIKEGEYILIEHGRWSRTIEIEGIKLNLVDYPKGVLAAAKEKPEHLGISKF